MAIHIDLRDLDRAALDECRPKAGECFYASPCVIGTLVPEELRVSLDDADVDGTSIKELLEAGLVTLPTEQIADAVALQLAFDGDTIKKIGPDWDEVERLAAPAAVDAWHVPDRLQTRDCQHPCRG